MSINLVQYKLLATKNMKHHVNKGLCLYYRKPDLNKKTSFVVYTTPTYKQVLTFMKIPKQYKEFKDDFAKKNIYVLLEYCVDNCTINLHKRAQLSSGSIYNFLQKRISALKDYIKKNLAKKIHLTFQIFYQCINTLCKKNKSLQMCTQYCGLNKVKINNHYMLLLIFRLFDQLKQAKIYTKNDPKELTIKYKYKKGTSDKLHSE